MRVCAYVGANVDGGVWRISSQLGGRFRSGSWAAHSTRRGHDTHHMTGDGQHTVDEHTTETRYGTVQEDTANKREKRNGTNSITHVLS